MNVTTQDRRIYDPVTGAVLVSIGDDAAATEEAVAENEEQASTLLKTADTALAETATIEHENGIYSAEKVKICSILWKAMILNQRQKQRCMHPTMQAATHIH